MRSQESLLGAYTKSLRWGPASIVMCRNGATVKKGGKDGQKEILGGGGKSSGSIL